MMMVMESATTVEFAAAARALTREARRRGLVGPSYRCPPRLVGVDRSIRRRPDGAVVSIRVHDRPRSAVIADMIETYREMVTGLMELYLTSVSNRMNEVMKVLTIIATIFIPLGFIAGIYGMNFTYMPELDSPWGYPMVYVIMLAIGAVMLVYFRRKKWL